MCTDTVWMHRHQWIIFLSNFILHRDFTSRFISYRIVYSILVGAGYICIYVCIYRYICIYTYIFMCICICMYMPANACYFVYMIICMSFMCAHFMYADFMMFFYLWLLGQRWPNKEVQTINYLCLNSKIFSHVVNIPNMPLKALDII